MDQSNRKMGMRESIGPGGPVATPSSLRLGSAKPCEQLGIIHDFDHPLAAVIAHFVLIEVAVECANHIRSSINRHRYNCRIARVIHDSPLFRGWIENQSRPLQLDDELTDPLAAQFVELPEPRIVENPSEFVEDSCREDKNMRRGGYALQDLRGRPLQAVGTPC